MTGGQWTTRTALGSPSRWLFTIVTSATANLSSGKTFLSSQINPDLQSSILALNSSPFSPHSLNHLPRHLDNIFQWCPGLKTSNKSQGWCKVRQRKGQSEPFTFQSSFILVVYASSALLNVVTTFEFDFVSHFDFSWSGLKPWDFFHLRDSSSI